VGAVVTLVAQNTFTSLEADFSAFSHLGPILLQTDAAGKDMSCGHQNILKTNDSGIYLPCQ